MILAAQEVAKYRSVLQENVFGAGLVANALFNNERPSLFEIFYWLNYLVQIIPSVFPVHLASPPTPRLSASTFLQTPRSPTQQPEAHSLD